MMISMLMMFTLPMIFFSPFMVLSSNNWFSMWMIMEMNLMSFIPIMIFLNKNYKENSMKYMIIQVYSSFLFLMSSSMFANSFFLKMNYFSYNLFINFLMISLFIKLGVSPFHSWFISIMNSSNWKICFILSTWQKFIPLILLNMLKYNLFMILIMLLSSITSFFGLNHQSLRMLMSYSSLNHMSWILMNLIFSKSSFFIYFFSYMIISFSIMILFHLMKLFYVNQLFLMKKKIIKFMFVFSILTLSGMPPLFGFMMKNYTVLISSENYLYLFLMMMMMISVISFFYYIRMILSFLLLYKVEFKQNLLLNVNMKLIYCIFIIQSIFMLWILSTYIFS